MKSLVLIAFGILAIEVVNSQDIAGPPADDANLDDNYENLTDDEIFDEFNRKFKVPFRRRVDFSKMKQNLGKRYREIQQQNRRYNQGLETFNRTLYPFSYLEDEDIGQYYLGAADPDPNIKHDTVNSSIGGRRGRSSILPESFEWPSEIVGRVKSQGQCGSCYAFAAIGVIKSRRAVLYGGKADDYDLSEQDAMECTRGCKGGWEYSIYRDYSQRYSGCAAYNFIKFHTYSGVAYACNANSRPRVPQTFVKRYVYLENNENTIKEYLVNYGPLYTRFNVYSNFYDYSKGIYSYYGGNYVGGHAGECRFYLY